MEHMELVFDIAHQQALDSPTHSTVFGTSGNIMELISYASKYDDIISLERSTAMSGSVGGDYVLRVKIN
jgi:hypothetical protein